MQRFQRHKLKFLACCSVAALGWGLASPGFAAEGANVQVAAQAPAPAAAPPAAGTATTENLDTKAILDRLDQLDARIGNLETATVLSEPKTIVKQVEQYVDQNGAVYDQPGPGRKAEVTYQRERVFRRQTIKDEIEEALAGQKENGIEIGVSSITTVQGALQTRGPKFNPNPNGHVFGVTQSDVTFLAQSAALNTSFFADVVAIGGPAPNGEVPALTLLNSQQARLSNNRLQMREAWVRTEFFGQKLGVTVGQLDLTNYFDRNAVANDETKQFISDALVNNQVLGLANNGLGVAAILDPKGSFNFKLGVQQSERDPDNPTASSLSASLFSLAEVEYIAVPFGLPEGHYRLWGRLDNSTGQDRTGWGISIDQKLNPELAIFGRYGNGDVGGRRVHFFSGGLGFQAPWTLNPMDRWGIGFAQTELVQTLANPGVTEKLAEGFYNLHLTDHLALSLMLQYVVESDTKSGFFIPGTRLGVEF